APAQLVARVHTQLEALFSSTLATHDELSARKPGSLDVAQTQLLAELDRDATTFAGKIATARHEASLVEGTQRVAQENLAHAQRGHEKLEGAIRDLEQAKLKRIEREVSIAFVSGRDSQAFARFNEDRA